MDWNGGAGLMLCSKAKCAHRGRVSRAVPKRMLTDSLVESETQSRGRGVGKEAALPGDETGCVCRQVVVAMKRALWLLVITRKCNVCFDCLIDRPILAALSLTRRYYLTRARSKAIDCAKRVDGLMRLFAC